MRPSRGTRRLALLVFLLTLTPHDLLAQQTSADMYVGDEACKRCHEAQQSSYAHTVHAKALSRTNALDELSARGCESCHGPGGAHVRSRGQDQTGPGWVDFRDEEPEARRRQEQACLQCHRGGRQRHWSASAHASRGVSCSSCHTVMKRVSERSLLSRPDEAGVCAQCHHLARAELMRSSHLPSREGASGAGGEGFMGCVSCHNSHGTIADKLIDAHTINDNCYSCHADKRGPFLWEHAPVSEDCLSCHVAHGSLKPGMLRISAPRLCQTCHIAVLHASEARVPNSRFLVGKSCQQCHPQVHGSNHPSGIFFTR